MPPLWPEQYLPRPDGRYRSFVGSPDHAPYTWPQDTLRVPNGFGSLPIVDNLNKNLSKRLFFGMNGMFPTVTQGSSQIVVLPTQDDGDFWCENLQIAIIDTSGDTEVTPYGYIQIEDISNNYALFPKTNTINGAPLSLFQNLSIGALQVTQTQGAPAGAGARSPWIQPYCFLRSCGIRVTVTLTPSTPPLSPSFNIYVNLSGWKEYAYAAV